MNAAPEQPEDDRRVLIYVHGRHYKPPEQEYFRLAIAAMTAGIRRDEEALLPSFEALDKRLAYYGDLSNDFLSARGERYDAPLDLGDLRNVLHQLSRVPKKKKFNLAAYDRLPGKSPVPEFAAGVAAPLLGSLGLSRPLIAKAVRELDEYWNEHSEFAGLLRERVRSVLGDALARGHRVLLVSHGSGCIVAWDVLWQLSHEEAYASGQEHRKLDTWITLGAPLGDSMVRRRLLGAKEKGRRRYPSNLLSWHNIAAEDDWFCHDSTLADDYRAMLKQKQISAIRDYRIYNLAVRYGKSDPHCSLGYLIHPCFARLVCDWLSQPPAVSAATGSP